MKIRAWINENDELEEDFVYEIEDQEEAAELLAQLRAEKLFILHD